MADKERKPREVRENREDNDFSHLMITSASHSDNSVIVKDKEGNTLFWAGHPDYGTGAFKIRDVSSETATGPLSSTLDQYPSDESWSKTGGISLDGLFVPYSTNFAVCSDFGQSSDKNRPNDGTNLPSFERPYATLDKDGEVQESIDISKDASHPQLGVNAPSPQHVTSVSLNPFASGHHIKAVNKNSFINNPAVDVDGFSEHSSNLVQAKSVSVETERPVGLRGPLVIAGWGYDTKGLPVPNMKFDADDKDKDGAQQYTPAQMRTDDKKHFIPNHLRRQDKWKVGPVDLRWDRKRKVWTGGTNTPPLYFSKSAKCILPKSGMDGNNSFDLGVGGNITSPGRIYRNPCPSEECSYLSYFPTSIYYPDIEIYDPEDHNWCGVCRTFGNVTGCGDFADGCVPFYDAFILRPMDEVVGGSDSLQECTDKFRKVQGGYPHARRAGNPCHGWGSSYMGNPESITKKIEDGQWTSTAKDILYQKIFVENPLGQGLMVGDTFFSYDTGKTITHTYTKSDTPGCGNQSGSEITVTEVIPVHIIVQAEFYGMEIITHAGCDRGEMAACSRKFFAQGFATGEDCGPDDDYPNTATAGL